MGDESLWCDHGSLSDPSCAEMRKNDLMKRGMGQWFTRSEVADNPAWTGLSIPTEWYQNQEQQASAEELERNLEAAGRNEFKSDWTMYPYDVPSYADGDGLFSNHESAEDRATADADSKPPAPGVDQFSFFWKVENPMGYPSGDLPARQTYTHDVTTGARSWESFWGGRDAIASDIEARGDWFREAQRPASLPSDDRVDYDTFWGAPAPGPASAGKSYPISPASSQACCCRGSGCSRLASRVWCGACES